MKYLLPLALVAALLVPAVVQAHPGHDHKLMGTISSIDKNKVVVKTTEGKDMTFEITPITAFKRGKDKGTATRQQEGAEQCGQQATTDRVHESPVSSR